MKIDKLDFLDCPIFVKSDKWEDYKKIVKELGQEDATFFALTKIKEKHKMETKEQLEAKIKELQAIVDKMPDEPKGLWKPKNGDKYWVIDCRFGRPMTNEYDEDTHYDKYILSLGLYAKTREQLGLQIEALQVHHKLKEIANELNAGKEIDWNNRTQPKHYMYLGTIKNEIYFGCEFCFKFTNSVYCLNEDFGKIAIKRIGKEKLERYLKEGF